MCGIVGVIGKSEAAAPRLLAGLKRLEYRGYDSAGIATLVDGRIERRRAEGKLGALADLLAGKPLPGTTGIGHTRWATHGAPTERNAHPHATADVTIVHNGIIENFRALRDELRGEGRNFATETDSEVIAHLIQSQLDRGKTPSDALAAALKRLEGAFAIAVMIRGQPGLMFGARRGSPLAVGWGEGEMYLGSDALALAPFTRHVTYLEEGDWVELGRSGARIHDAEGRAVERPRREIAHRGDVTDKGNFQHFMQKEIHEQPAVIGDTLSIYLDPAERTVRMPKLPFDFARISRLNLIACGTSFYAGQVARYWFEGLARLPVEVDIASEFRYRQPVFAPGGLSLFVSQSGETADTLAALRLAKSAGQHVAALVNVPESSMAREADVMLRIDAGTEVGVASTKAFTCQLVTLACLAVAAAKARGQIDAQRERALAQALIEVPARVNETLTGEARLQKLAEEVARARDVLYIGRGTSYPIALEGALKLKEISYIHAEGYAAGELKHGPIALIDPAVPVIVVAPPDELFEKTVSNMHEVMARGGRVLLMSDREGIDKAGRDYSASFRMPSCDPFVAPILYAVPVQLLAYHVAILKGTNVDQPRNLAKSVTVE
ncbi:MAG: glutamine--fructose-6-phosphate transaminase (isomerizing) [Alphaproteobacteria bacterium]|nr:glutamine--fructose-6-phosphate transaminase (isomerizing) [Alphaproteobacteria bacterium]